MKTKLKVLISTGIILSSILYTGCSSDSTYDQQAKRTSTITTITDEQPKDIFVTAEIFSKEHIEEKDINITKPVSYGKIAIVVPKTQHQDEKFNVTLKYQDVTTTVNNKDLYNRVKKGDKIKVRLFKSWTGFRSLMI